MKIAYIVPYVPNLIRTRPYNLITKLASLGHEVVVFTLGSGNQDISDVEALKAGCEDICYHVQPVWRSLWNSAIAVASNQPLQSVYSWQKGMARNIAERVSREKFDIIHVEHLRGSRYGVYLKSRFSSMPIVWDSVDCISYLFQQAADQSSGLSAKSVARFELTRTRKAEGNLICSFDHILVTSSADKNALMELAPHGRKPSPISVLPNGVDLDYFHPNPAVQRDPATIVFTGKMSYHANVSMVHFLVSEIMPRIWGACPETKLFIVGKDPPSDIRKLEKHSLITVTGTVDDIRPFLWRATVAVVPLLYGAGIQNKILEAMATGTPVVTTPKALSSLQVQPVIDLFVGNDPDEFSRAVVRLIKDRNLQQKIGDAGETYVRTYHSWKRIALQLVNLYQQTISSRVHWLPYTSLEREYNR